MAQAQDISGQKFGRLTAIRFVGISKDRHAIWECRCDCGNNCVSLGRDLRSGRTKSCGCYQRQRTSEARKVHGLRSHPLYTIWSGMRDRCHKVNDPAYSNYGGRGITVCDEWRHDFQAFYDWSMENGYAKGLSIDRIDNDKGYCPDNCRWATRAVQNNNSRHNHNLTYNGRTQSISVWAEEIGLKYTTLQVRINRGWSVERALTTPVKKRD